MDAMPQQWNGYPQDRPGREEAERSADETQAEYETARLLGVPLIDVMQWEGRLTVRQLNEPTKGE